MTRASQGSVEKAMEIVARWYTGTTCMTELIHAGDRDVLEVAIATALDEQVEACAKEVEKWGELNRMSGPSSQLATTLRRMKK